MVVVGNTKLHLIGDLEGVPYKWYWWLQDVFHGVGGIFLATMHIALACAITAAGNAAISAAAAAVDRHRGSRTKIVSVQITLQRRLKGFHVVGEVVNLGKAWPFVFATFVLLFSTLVDILQHQLVAHVDEE